MFKIGYMEKLKTGHKKAFNPKGKGYITNTMNNTKFSHWGIKATKMHRKDTLSLA